MMNGKSFGQGQGIGRPAFAKRPFHAPGGVGGSPPAGSMAGGWSSQPNVGSWTPGDGRPPWANMGQSVGQPVGQPMSGGTPATPAAAGIPTDSMTGWQKRLPEGSTWTPGDGQPPWANGGQSAGVPAAPPQANPQAMMGGQSAGAPSPTLPPQANPQASAALVAALLRGRRGPPMAGGI